MRSLNYPAFGRCGAMALVLGVSAGLACKTTELTEGLPCESDDECFPGQACVEGICGGPDASSTSSGDGDAEDDGSSGSSSGGSEDGGDGDTGARSVFIYDGAAVGGTLTLADLQAAFEADGHDVTTGPLLPDDVGFDTVCVVNPTEPVDAALASQLQGLLPGGGRLIVLTDECTGANCISAPGDVNDFLGGVGSTMTVSGDPGQTGEGVGAIVPFEPYTDGVITIAVSDTGSIDVGSEGIALAYVEMDASRAGGATNVVLAVEPVGSGEILVVSDTDIFASLLDSDDNATLLSNLP